MKIQMAKGVQDTPPAEKLLKNEIIDRMKKIFELYGFMPLETTILERYETLAAKFAAGEASDALREVFKLKDQGDRDLALRFDLTVPLSRYVALNSNIKMPFKRYEVGPVFRDGPIKLGRTREFWQMDIDTVGTASMLADAEIIAMVNAVFNELEMDVVIKVNNRKLLNGILNEIGIKEKEEAIISIDKLYKIGEIGVTKELLEKGYQKEQISRIFEIIKIGITLEELKDKINDKESMEGIKELEELFSCLKDMKIENAVFDISLARGLAYYTGPVFEAYLKEGVVKSSLAGGGRYDNMIGNYLGDNRIVPATGISFGLVPIMEIMKNKSIKTTSSKIYIISLGALKESLRIVQELRKNKIPSEIDLTKRGISKNLDYANSLGIPYVLIIGENELKAKKLKLKNMQSGDEKLVTEKELIKYLKNN